MHTVIWTFKLPVGTSRAQLMDAIRAGADAYKGVPGLIRKYYGIAPDGGSIAGIYLWETEAAAEAFYTSEWRAMVTQRWGAAPVRQDWDIPMVVESAEHRLIAAE
jgi:hypothetical protein